MDFSMARKYQYQSMNNGPPQYLKDLADSTKRVSSSQDFLQSALSNMFHLIFLSALLAAASAGFLPFAAPITYGHPAPIVTYAAPLPIPSTQYRAQDTLGQFSYGYATGNGIAKNEVGGIDGSVAGGYSYLDPEGKTVSISYTAGADGFKASGDALPKPVEPTPEVAEATKNHLKAKEEAAARAAAAPEEPKILALHAPLTYALANGDDPKIISLGLGHQHFAPLPYSYAGPIAAPHVKVLLQPKIIQPTGYKYSFSTLG